MNGNGPAGHGGGSWRVLVALAGIGRAYGPGRNGSRRGAAGSRRGSVHPKITEAGSGSGVVAQVTTIGQRPAREQQQPSWCWSVTYWKYGVVGLERREAAAPFGGDLDEQQHVGPGAAG